MYQRYPLEALYCEKSSLGGSKEYLWVMRAEHVSSIPSVCNGEETSEPIQIKSGTASVCYKFPHETLGFKENQRYGPGGEYFEIILEGFRDRIAPHHQHEICKLAPGYYLVIYQDANGYVRLLGTPDKPLRFTSQADTKKQRGELNGVLWRFYGVSKCPAIFMDPSIEPPNELLIPLANLNINRNFALGSCFWQLSASGSQLSDGTAITAATVYGTAVLTYLFYYGNILLYEVTIGPDEDATNTANWNYIGGARSQSDFEAQIVDNIVAGGTGFSFTVDLAPLSIMDSGSALTIDLVVDDWSQMSSPSRKSIGLCFLRYAFSMTTTLDSGFDFDMKHTGPGNIYIDWGDGQVDTFSNQTLFSTNNYAHNYSEPGIYKVDVYMSAGNVQYLDFVSEAVIDLDINSCINIETIYGRSNAIQNPQNWQNFLLLDEVNIRSNSDLQYLYLPSALPISPLRSFISYLTDIQNAMDFRAFAATLEWVEIRGNSDLPFCDVAGCSLLADYVANNCNIQNDQDLTGCTSLVRAELHNNSNLAFVDVSGLLNLEIYKASSCNIQNDQDISSSSSIQEAWLDNNQIQNINFGTHAALTIFYAHNNLLSGSYNFNNCVNLGALNLSNNNLTDVIFDQCTGLYSIDLDDNNIDTTELNRIVDDVFIFRATTAGGGKILDISGNPGVLSATSLDKINGTGTFMGDGLIDNGWNVIL
jgi:hypothetical protein